jgi:hypothetical protein
MSASKMTHVVDRLALSLMNILVVVGLPLVAISLFVQTR